MGIRISRQESAPEITLFQEPTQQLRLTVSGIKWKKVIFCFMKILQINEVKQYQLSYQMEQGMKY